MPIYNENSDSETVIEFHDENKDLVQLFKKDHSLFDDCINFCEKVKAEGKDKNEILNLIGIHINSYKAQSANIGQSVHMEYINSNLFF